MSGEDCHPNIGKPGKRPWRLMAAAAGRTEPKFALNEPAGPYLRLDGQGRIIACHSSLREMLPAGWPGEDVLLSSVQISPGTWREEPPERWPAELPLLKLRMGKGREGHFAATLSREQNTWLLTLVDIGDLVRRMEGQERLLHLLRQGAAIAQRLRQTSGDLTPVVMDWLENLSTRMKLPWLAIMTKSDRAWQCAQVFEPPGAPPGSVLPSEIVENLENRNVAPRQWRSAAGDAFWLVPYLEGAVVKAWLCCAGTPDVANPWCGPEEWSQLFAQIAAPLVSDLSAREFQRVNARYRALDRLISGGWWEYWPDKGLVRLAPNFARSLGRADLVEGLLGYSDWLAQMDPLDRDEFHVKLSKTLEDEPLLHSARFEIDGKPHWYCLEGEAVDGAEGPHVVGFAFNTDQIHARENRAEVAMARLQGFIDSAPGIIYVQNYENGCLRTSFCSASVERVLEFTADEFMNRPFASYVHPDDVDIYFEHIRKLIKLGRSSAQYRAIGKMDKVHWLQ